MDDVTNYFPFVMLNVRPFAHKRACFSVEDEMRSVISPAPEEEARIQHRVSGDVIIPYVDSKDFDFKIPPITKIIIGPAQHQDNIMSSIKDYLIQTLNKLFINRDIQAINNFLGLFSGTFFDINTPLNDDTRKDQVEIFKMRFLNDSRNGDEKLLAKSKIPYRG